MDQVLCPHLIGYMDGKDCDPVCTLTGGSKECKNCPCTWPNINNGEPSHTYRCLVHRDCGKYGQHERHDDAIEDVDPRDEYSDTYHL